MAEGSARGGFYMAALPPLNASSHRRARRPKNKALAACPAQLELPLV